MGCSNYLLLLGISICHFSIILSIEHQITLREAHHNILEHNYVSSFVLSRSQNY